MGFRPFGVVEAVVDARYLLHEAEDPRSPHEPERRLEHAAVSVGVRVGGP